MEKMTSTAFREIMTVLLVSTFMGAAWGWWPLFGFLQGSIALLWLIARLLEKVLDNH